VLTPPYEAQTVVVVSVIAYDSRPWAPFRTQPRTILVDAAPLAARSSTFLPFLTDLMKISAMSMRYR
jgi:hypothetical protein